MAKKDALPAEAAERIFDIMREQFRDVMLHVCTRWVRIRTILLEIFK